MDSKVSLGGVCECPLDIFEKQESQKHFKRHSGTRYRFEKVKVWICHWFVTFCHRILKMSQYVTEFQKSKFCHRMSPCHRQSILWAIHHCGFPWLICPLELTFQNKRTRGWAPLDTEGRQSSNIQGLKKKVWITLLL